MKTRHYQLNTIYQNNFKLESPEPSITSVSKVEEPEKKYFFMIAGYLRR